MVAGQSSFLSLAESIGRSHQWRGMQPGQPETVCVFALSDRWGPSWLLSLVGRKGLGHCLKQDRAQRWFPSSCFSYQHSANGQAISQLIPSKWEKTKSLSKMIFHRSHPPGQSCPVPLLTSHLRVHRHRCLRLVRRGACKIHYHAGALLGLLLLLFSTVLHNKYCYTLELAYRFFPRSTLRALAGS